MSMNFYLGDTTNAVRADVYQTRTEDTEMILGGCLQYLEGQAALEAVHRYFELVRRQALESQKYYQELRVSGRDVEDWEIDYQIEQCEEHIDKINQFINFVGVDRLEAGYV